MDIAAISAVLSGALTLILLIALIIIVLKQNNTSEDNTAQITEAVKREVLPAVRDEISRQNSSLRQELSAQTQTSVKTMGDLLSENQRSFSQQQSEKLNALEVRFKTFSESTEQKLENIRQSTEKQLEANRQTTEKQLEKLQNDNSVKLEEMRKTVDEKLQKTLEEKMNQSFSLVNQRLEQVYKGLGEMQTLAVGVGDLKKVLSNVKTRGILGEIQLGSILTEILSPEQYEENIATKKGSKNVV